MQKIVLNNNNYINNKYNTYKRKITCRRTVKKQNKTKKNKNNDNNNDNNNNNNDNDNNKTYLLHPNYGKTTLSNMECKHHIY